LSCFPDDNLLTAQYRAGLFLLMKISHDPSASGYEHVGKGLRRSDLNPDPIKQFGNWFTAAIEAGKQAYTQEKRRNESKAITEGRPDWGPGDNAGKDDVNLLETDENKG